VPLALALLLLTLDQRVVLLSLLLLQRLHLILLAPLQLRALILIVRLLAFLPMFRLQCSPFLGVPGLNVGALLREPRIQLRVRSGRLDWRRRARRGSSL
jgi:hypothetical protein